MQFLNASSLRLKLSLVVIATSVVVLALFGLAAVIYLRGATIAEAEKTLVRQNNLVREMIAVTDESMKLSVAQAEAFLLKSFEGKSWSISSSRKVMAGTREVPELLAGNTLLNNRNDELDSYASAVPGGAASLVVRDGDDFVRIATTVKDKDGKRLAGVVVDRASPAYAALIKGETFIARSTLAGKEFLAVYRPVIDAAGSVIGATLAGVDVSTQIAALKKRIRDIKVGETGYVYVLDSRENASKGVLIVHPAKEGQSILESKDSTGREFIKELLDKKNGVLYYDWQNAELGDKTQRKKVVAFNEYKDWNWVIGSGSYLSEFTAVANGIGWRAAGFTLLNVVILSLVLNWALTRLAFTPLSRLQKILAQISRDRDFSLRAPVQSQDEIGAISESVNDLVGSVQNSLQSFHRGAEEVVQASRRLNETARTVSRASLEQSDASSAVASTVEQMTVSVGQVSDRAEEAHTLSSASGKLAQTGSATIEQTIRDIREIAGVVSAAAGSIRDLESRSAQVAGVIQIIREVADQTNLLALNAAIEAARAGEQGRGFAVVADEVRKLAERTTVSTQDVAKNIEIMRQASIEATEKMQSAESLVSTGVSRADEADHSIRQIGKSAQDASDAVSHISNAIREQEEASTNIASQVERIARMSEEASTGAQDVASSASQLDSFAARQMELLGQYRF